MKSQLTETIVRECKNKLLMLKKDLLNKVTSQVQFLSDIERGGDEVDQTVAQIEEHHFLINQERIRRQLFEIEMALARIEEGHFGICEETQEPIEVERLKALPWTRLSIEGAEIREAMNKRYVR